MNLTVLREVLNNKRLMIIGGIVVLTILVFGMQFLSKPSRQPETGASEERDMDPETTQLIQEAQSLQGKKAEATQPPSESVALQLALKEAEQAAQEYDSSEDANWKKYPWINKLPIVGEKYYAYFELEKAAFIGKLYPKAGDNVEQLKETVKKELKEGKGIPIENYRIEWQIIPK